jgi:YidC/Oxa1 family membrane protein insertase
MTVGHFIDTILNPLIYMTSWIIVQFHKVFGSVFGSSSGWAWGLSIVALTVVLRAAMIPLFVRQIKSMRNMQELQPRIKEIQQRYKLDRERQSQEMMKLYRETGTNPLASCLPILIQAPFWSALYRMLDHVANDQPTGFLTTSLANSAHKAHIFGIPIGFKFLSSSATVAGSGVTTGEIKIVTGLMILFMVATQFITQRQLIVKNVAATGNQFAQQQKIMMYIFPVFMLVIGINFPIGLLVYMLTTNVWTMGQQLYVIRNNPMPGSPAAAERDARLKAKAAQKALKVAAQTPGVVAADAEETADEATTVSANGGSAASKNGSGGATKNPAAAGAGGYSRGSGGQRSQPVRKSKSKRKR